MSVCPLLLSAFFLIAADFTNLADHFPRIGCFCGAVTVFLIGERLGRKKCMYVGATLMFIGAALQASSFGVPQMLVGRIVW